MKKIGTYQVKQVALFANVSVRTLHYYDEIGLLVPVLRSKAGYRLYDSENLLRLQQIMIGRKLGLSLEDIRKSLDDENFDLKATFVQSASPTCQPGFIYHRDDPSRR